MNGWKVEWSGGVNEERYTGRKGGISIKASQQMEPGKDE